MRVARAGRESVGSLSRALPRQRASIIARPFFRPGKGALSTTRYFQATKLLPSSLFRILIATSRLSSTVDEIERGRGKSNGFVSLSRTSRAGEVRLFIERIESFRKLVQPGRMEPLEGSRDRRKSERFNNEIARVLRGEQSRPSTERGGIG